MCAIKQEEVINLRGEMKEEERNGGERGEMKGERGREKRKER